MNGNPTKTRLRLAALCAIVLSSVGCDGSPALRPGELPPEQEHQQLNCPAPSPPVAQCTDGWCVVAAGCFTMGSSTALSGCHAAIHPQRQVQLTHDFVIAETEVTQRSFRELLGYNPSTFADCGDGCPVDSVSWHEAAAYCNALSVQQGLTACYRCEGSADSVRCSPAEGVSDLAVHSCPGFRLPTEAEWEHAARAGSTSAYPNGDPATCDDLSKMAEQVAWFVDNAAGTVHEVRGKLPNARGLYDTSGNVEEWTDDWFHEAAEFDAVDPVAGAGFGHSKVLRGGSHNSRAEQARNSSRSQQATEARSSEIGFRCLRSVP